MWIGTLSYNPISIDGFKAIEQIGHSACDNVYLALDRRTSQRVAIKVINKDMSGIIHSDVYQTVKGGWLL
jgi:serine/threonine protein kinase